MHLTQILTEAGAHKRRKRVGRGPGSGHGKTSTKGHKGSCSRAGAQRGSLREGGQMQLLRRIPKRGFSNAPFKVEYSVVNVADLEKAFAAGAHVTPEAIAQAGLIRNLRNKVKVLGEGTLTKKFKVEAAKFSKSAEEKIRAAGGEVVVLA
jgi:large subunit ribosomal protein L15